MDWNVIWQVDPDAMSSCIERDWFQDLFRGITGPGVVDYEDGRPRLSAVLPNAIVCASCPNQTRPSDLVSYLARLPRPRILYHMSDEYLAVGEDVYDHCDLVFRNGSADFGLLGRPGLIQLPLGYATGFRNAGEGVPDASSRRCSFAFLGTIKNERASDMLPALDRLPGPSFVRPTPSFAAGTRYFGRITIAVYRNAVFVPNPRGNWNPECNRLYDALEWGCIPLIRRYDDDPRTADYHDRLFGRHPLPTFGSWSQAADFAAAMLADRGALDGLQARISAWWQDYKADLRRKVTDALAAIAP